MDNHTNIRQIKLHGESMEIIKEVFDRYKDVTDQHPGYPPTFLEDGDNLTVHMYPIKDTYSENGDLNGYRDVLFAKVDLYYARDLDLGSGHQKFEKIRYSRYTDAWSFKGIDFRAMIWKDGAYIFSINGPAHICWGAAPEVIGPGNDLFKRLQEYLDAK